MSEVRNPRCIVSQATTLKALAAELEAARALTELLQRQRDALIAQDTERLDEVTARLQEQFGQFRYMVQTREAALGEAPDLGPDEVALLRELRTAESELQILAEVNQQILADRLAYVRALLGQIYPQEQAVGYAPVRRTGKAHKDAPSAATPRSA